MELTVLHTSIRKDPMGALILTHGLPGSGKSSLAQRLRELFPGRVSVAERDEIRAEILPADYHSRGHDEESEARVEARQHELLEAGLLRDELVVVSDTNLVESRIRRLVAIARSTGARIFHVHFDLPVAECKRRNESRAAAGGRLVPNWVIEDMAAYGYSADRLKHFSIFPTGDGAEDFEVLIEDRRGNELSMETEIELIRLTALESSGLLAG